MPDATPAPATPPTTTSGALAPSPAPAATPPAAGSPPAASTNDVNPGAWMAGFDDDMKGWATNKGYKGPGDLANAYRQLEKTIGVPPDRIVKLPESFYDEKGMLTAEGRAIKERLGAPKELKDYGIEAPKEGGDPKRLENFLNAAHRLGLTAREAQELAKVDGEYIAGMRTGLAEQAQQKFRDDDAALRKEWGAAFDQNKGIAAEGMRRLNISAQQVDALAGQLGHAETMKLLKNLGSSVSEGTFVRGGGRPDGVMEPAAAKSRIAELKLDTSFGAKLLNGDAEAKATWQRLHELAYQGTVNL
jgi:hypothetical protein